MIVERPPDDASIEKKISWAKRVFHRLRNQILTDERITRLLERLKTAIAESRTERSRTGIVALCTACEQREGGSCCGAGMERRYSATLLLINLFLGVKLPEERMNPSSCFFLGNEGCRLMARHVICVNYLCKKITDKVSIPQLAALREKEGVELEVLFLLNERLRDILESRFYSSGSPETS
ncbi:MAG: hypothetical protein JRJ66_00440 [Deltaproteobacteria bacterium]|nr:hypothetical protein [Deltaproteobacteria bacterium]